MITQRSVRLKQRGISVVEVLIALAAGLVVIGSVLAFTVATIQMNGETIAATRLNQELRSVMDVISRELRRAGFNSRALETLGDGATSANHSTIVLRDPDADGIGDCLMFGYDVFDAVDGSGNPVDSTPGAIAAEEWKGFRLAVVDGVGVVQFRTDGASAMTDCDSADNDWVDISSPESVNVTSLAFSVVNDEALGIAVDTASGNNVNVEVRRVGLDLAAELTRDSSVARSLEERIRIRADRIFQTAP